MHFGSHDDDFVLHLESLGLQEVQVSTMNKNRAQANQFLTLHTLTTAFGILQVFKPESNAKNPATNPSIQGTTALLAAYSNIQRCQHKRIIFTSKYVKYTGIFCEMTNA